MSGHVWDPANANAPQLDKEFRVFKNGGSVDISRGDCVGAVVGGSGEVQQTASTTSRVVGVAAQDIPVGEVGLVQTYGYCDYVKTDGNVTGTDTHLTPAANGACLGVSSSDASDAATAFQLAAFAFAYSLGADVGTTGTCFIFK